MSEAQRPTTFREPMSPGEVVRRYWLRLLLLVAALAFGVQWFRTSFYDEGYAPEQPIAFPHNRHAGDLGIDCKYCHFNATRGKHAGVPPMSVCLGCHGAANGQVAADKPGIQKLNEIADKGQYTDDAGVVHEGGVVHWNRVHKLPDFVYFPHRWHVAAGVACQTCHGPVETMAVVRQYATLTMGWCLECHRRGNYVGGRDYQHDRPETFTVGTANYDVARARVAYDDVVEFVARDTKAHPRGTEGAAEPNRAVPDPAHATEAAAPAGERTMQYTEKLLPSSGGLPPEYRDQIKGVIAKNPRLADLPAWRIVDLPETHQAIYRQLVEDDRRVFMAQNKGQEPTAEQEREFFLHRSFMNSPTQCSTCHQ